MAYFLVQNTEDGMEIRLIPDIHQFLGESSDPPVYVAKFPGDAPWFSVKQEDLGNDVILIKGEIVTPRPVEKVTRYEVD